MLLQRQRQQRQLRPSCGWTVAAGASTILLANILAGQLAEVVTAARGGVGACRDRFERPFAIDSIWNTPVGRGAAYRALPGLFAGSAAEHRGAPTLVQIDQDSIVRVASTDPQVAWYSQSWWGKPPSGATNHCAPIRPGMLPARTIALPESFLNLPAVSGNNALALLMPDNRTVVQTQPAFRCTPGGPLFSKFGNGTDGCPTEFPNTTDILGDGALGAHGGSGESLAHSLCHVHEDWSMI